VTLRRIVVSLLAVAVIGAGGTFVRRQWHNFSACGREFAKDSTDYEICTEYGGSHAACGALDTAPFSCSDEAIGGRRKSVAARDTGIFRTRLECATHNQVTVGSRCSPAQWDAWCAARHPGRRQLGRCRAAGPDGPEGAPPATGKATVSKPVGPLAGAPPATGCRTVTTYQLPDPNVVSLNNPAGSRPGAVALDPDGSVWFTEFLSGSISHMTLDGTIIRRFLPTQPGALVRDPVGNLWFSDNVTSAIWRVTPEGASLRLPPPRSGGPSDGPPGPADLTVAADGTVWFLESQGGRVARVNPDLTITEVSLTRSGDGYVHPSSLSAAPDGSIWVALALAGRIARVDGRTLQVTHFGVPGGGSGVVRAASVAVGSDGGVWFEIPNASTMQAPSDAALGRMGADGSVSYHPLPGAARWPGSLTAGPDGAVWFLDGPGRTVGRMSPDGTLTEFAFADQSTSGGTLPRQLAAGSDRLWFAEPHANSLGLITCGGT
jgi:virginiamycin B lyase